MKSIIKSEGNLQEIKYPCLMKSAVEIVLFSEYGVGTVVYCFEKVDGHLLGDHSECWNMDKFTYYPTIGLFLSNEE